jgi:hypothetical protein
MIAYPFRSFAGSFKSIFQLACPIFILSSAITVHAQSSCAIGYQQCVDAAANTEAECVEEASGGSQRAVCLQARNAAVAECLTNENTCNASASVYKAPDYLLADMPYVSHRSFGSVQSKVITPLAVAKPASNSLMTGSALSHSSKSGTTRSSLSRSTTRRKQRIRSTPSHKVMA